MFFDTDKEKIGNKAERGRETGPRTTSPAGRGRDIGILTAPSKMRPVRLTTGKLEHFPVEIIPIDKAGSARR